MGSPFLLCIVARSNVNLIQGASRAIVLSDFGTDAARGTGALGLTFARCGLQDRDPAGAMRPARSCLGRESFHSFSFWPPHSYSPLASSAGSSWQPL